MIRTRPPLRPLVLALHLGFAAVIVYFLVDGLSYYLTPLIERPRHPQFWQLKPGGSEGHSLGTVGALMMCVMLLYSVRKRWSAMRGMGPLSTWLDFHILLGIWGPALVILHSSFKVQGLVAVSFWSMIAVAASGFFGRFIYVQIPRTRAGDELSLERVEELDRENGLRLRESFGLDTQALERLDRTAERYTDPGRSFASLLFGLLVDPLTLRWRLRTITRPFGRTHPRLARSFRKAAIAKVSLRRRMLLSERLQGVLHYWHVAHKPFAALMYIFMLVHIGVAVSTGYGWGFR